MAALAAPDTRSWPPWLRPRWCGESWLAGRWCPPIWAKGNRLAQPVSDRRGDEWVKGVGLKGAW